MAALPWDRGTLGGAEDQSSGASLLVLPCTCCSNQSFSTTLDQSAICVVLES
jgi:hypothetical protein